MDDSEVRDYRTLLKKYLVAVIEDDATVAYRCAAHGADYVTWQDYSPAERAALHEIIEEIQQEL